MPIEQIIDQFRRATMKAGKGTVIDPLTWVAAILALAAVLTQANHVLSLVFAGMLGCVVLMILGVYSYCLVKGKMEPLRSETFTAVQMAMQRRGFKGDDLKAIGEVFSDRDVIANPGLPAPQEADTEPKV